MTNEEAFARMNTVRAAALLLAEDEGDEGQRLDAEALRIVLGLARQVDGLRGHLKSIREIEDYVAGRKCACSGVGCVQCIARVALDGGELIS